MKLTLNASIYFFLFVPFATQNQIPVQTDPIVGIWSIEKISYSYSDGSSHEMNSMKCSNSKIFKYLADGTFEFRSYELNDDTNQCTKPSNDFWEGTWKRDEFGNYIRTLSYKYKSKERSQYTDSTSQFKFSDNNDTMIQIQYFEASGATIDRSTDLIEERTVFKRLE